MQGLPKKFDQKKILKVIKKKFACNGTIVSDTEMGEVIQLQGDQRKDVQEFLVDKKDGLGLDSKTIKVSSMPLDCFPSSAVTTNLSLLLLRSMVSKLRAFAGCRRECQSSHTSYEHRNVTIVTLVQPGTNDSFTSGPHGTGFV